MNIRTTADELRQRFAEARSRGLRAREAAEAIGLSEGAAVAAHVGGHDQPLRAVPLQPRWLEILQSLEACGPLMARPSPAWSAWPTPTARAASATPTTAASSGRRSAC